MYQIIEEGLDGRQGKKRAQTTPDSVVWAIVCLFFNVQIFIFIIYGIQRHTAANTGPRRQKRAQTRAWIGSKKKKRAQTMPDASFGP